MDLPIKTTFKDLSIYIDKLQVEIFNLTNTDDFSSKSKDVGIWHSILIHHTATKEKNAVGDLLLIFKNANKETLQALSITLRISAKGSFEKDFAMMHQIIHYIFELANDYVKENNIKDQNDNAFLVPQFNLPDDYFQFGFPD